MLVPNRHANTPEYRYGFQGQEMDDELKGEGNSLNYTFRMHDPRVGRFFASDPLERGYPWYTPYSFSGNKVIAYTELEGAEEHWVVKDNAVAYISGPQVAATNAYNTEREAYLALNKMRAAYLKASSTQLTQDNRTPEQKYEYQISGEAAIRDKEFNSWFIVSQR